MVAGRDEKATPVDAASEKPEKVPQTAIKETITAKAGDGAIDLPVTLLVTTGTSGARFLPISAGSMSTWMTLACGAKAASRPVTRSSKRTPSATSTG